jgi:hypothetical protein
MNNNKLSNSIIKKWNKQGTFIRFINGDTFDCRRSNLMYVSLKDAMEHINLWKVDWDMNLTKQEIELVKDPNWRSGLQF